MWRLEILITFTYRHAMRSLRRLVVHALVVITGGNGSEVDELDLSSDKGTGNVG